MILVGIDVAKDKHDCCITNTDGEMLFDIFTITNNSESFDILYERIRSVAPDLSKVKVGLRQPDITTTTFSHICLTSISPLMSLTRFTRIFIAKD